MNFSSSDDRTQRPTVTLGLLAALCAVTLLWSPAASAQPQSRDLPGRVVSGSFEPVAGATVEVLGAPSEARTDASGAFRIRLTVAATRLRVRRLGFRPSIVDVPSIETRPESLLVVLEAAPESFQQVLIVGSDRVGTGQEVTRASARILPPLGEPDALRALPFMSSVSQPDDFDNRFHLAGSAADEVLITFDGHPLQSPTHVGGALSAFNLAAIERTSLQIHSMRPAVDTRLGGVLEVTSRKVERPQREMVASLLSASGTVLQPFAGSRASLLVSARRTFLSEVVDRISAGSPGDPSLLPSYTDALARMEVDLGGGWKSSLLAMYAGDTRRAATSALRDDFQSSEALFGVRAAGPLRGWNLSTRASIDRFRASQANRLTQELDYEEIRLWVDANLEASRTLGAAGRITLNAGGADRTHEHAWRFSSSFSDVLPVNFDGRSGLRLAQLGAAYDVAIGTNWMLGLGSRLTSQSGAWYAAPGLSLKRAISLTSHVTFDIGRRWQFDAESGPPRSASVQRPLFLLAQPRRLDAAAITIESEKRLRAFELRWNASVFTRAFADRARAQPADAGDTTTQSRLSFDRGGARARGASVGATVLSSRGLVVQASYSFTRAIERDGERRVPSDWDIPHTLAAVLSVPLPGRLTFASSAQWHSGVPITPLDSRVLVPSTDPSQPMLPRPVLGERNSRRVLSFARVDAGLRRTWRPGRVEVVGSLQVVNLFARDNALSYDMRRYLTAPQSLEAARARSGLPLVPSLGVEVRW